MQPTAWNVELAHPINPKIEVALRVEGSTELGEAPTLQYGAVASWRVLPNVSVSIEYLRGEYSNAFSDAKDSDRIGTNLSIAF